MVRLQAGVMLKVAERPHVGTRLEVEARLQAEARLHVKIRIYVISGFYLNILAFTPECTHQVLREASQLCLQNCSRANDIKLWLKNDWFSSTNSKQITLLLESQEENEDLVPTGIWGIVVYILLPILYIMSSPNTKECRKIMQIMFWWSAMHS